MIDAGWDFLMVLSVGLLAWLVVVYVQDWRVTRAFWREMNKRVGGKHG